jgi:hypothetical protein
VVFIEDGASSDTRIFGPDGTEVPIRSRSSSASYGFSDRSGESLGDIEVTTPGTHQVENAGAGAVAFADTSVVNDLLFSLLVGVFGFLLGGVLLVAGLVVLLVSFLRR